MGMVKLVAVTQPMIEGVKTAEDLIAYCARVSNPSNQLNLDTSAKLLRYCIKNSHWSIFEMVSMAVEINTTRDIARQILRHRSFNFQEFSQRYADPTKELTFVAREARLQDTKNRQNSTMTTDKALNQEWEDRQRGVILRAQTTYEWAIKHGIAKEQARSVLPEGCTMSRLYMSGTVRSWGHYCQLRRANGTQLEHRQIADQCWQIFTQQFPITAQAMEEKS